MNLSKINLTIIAILLIGILNPSNFLITSNAQNSSELDLNQQNPNIEISSIILDNNLPDEGEEITATVLIENMDDIEYFNLLIQITLVQSEDGPGEGQSDIMVGNEIIDSISAQGSETVDVVFIAPAGLYDATAIIVYNNLPIVDSEISILLQVKSPKVGDNETPLIAIGFLAIFFVLFLLSQATYDAIKLKNATLETNGKK